jgi:hypothetical protein
MADVGGREAEIEAVARAISPEAFEGHYASRPGRDLALRRARDAITALDAVRSSGSAAQNQEGCDCDEPLGGHRDDCPQWGDNPAQNQEPRSVLLDTVIGRHVSPQDEDHEAEANA